jgi:hypothetical protein
LISRHAFEHASQVSAQRWQWSWLWTLHWMAQSSQMAAQSPQIATENGLSAIMLLMQSEQIWMHSRQQLGQRLAEPLIFIAARHSSQARMQVWQLEMQGWDFMMESCSQNPSHFVRGRL